MITLRVTYKDDQDEVRSTKLTAFTPQGPDGFIALPAVVEEGVRLLYQRFRYQQIVDAVDESTGELIDVHDVCGTPTRPGEPLSKPPSKARPLSKRLPAGDPKALRKIRSIDRNTYSVRFRLEIIEKFFFWKLWLEFRGRCFACGSPQGFLLDHHVPLVRGGRREPGNIVLLCNNCNVSKKDTPPEDFYSNEELEFLKPILERQQELLAFVWNSKAFAESKYKYLVSVGIHPLHVQEALTNPDIYSDLHR